jgi:hypothetical protein
MIIVKRETIIWGDVLTALFNDDWGDVLTALGNDDWGDVLTALGNEC